MAYEKECEKCKANKWKVSVSGVNGDAIYTFVCLDCGNEDTLEILYNE